MIGMVTRRRSQWLNPDVGPARRIGADVCYDVATVR